MAQYKVIQDIEAEDKLVGPLSLRQFIYAGGAGLCIYLSVICVMKGAPFLVAIFVPPALFCMFFAWPWSPDQPTEVWALARIRFYFKPRRRIWDQSGSKDLVTITAPKKKERIYTNGLSQSEVKSRLGALASTIDSRGWATKNININMSVPSDGSALEQSDRLIDMSSMPQQVSNVDIQAADDILDETSNPIAQQFDHMISEANQAHRQQLMERMRDNGASVPPQPTPAGSNQPVPNYWFMEHPAVSTAQPAAPVAATPTATEEAFAAQLREQNKAMHAAQNLHMRTLNPIDDQPAQPVAQVAQVAQPAAPPVTPQTDAAILNLASNDDLNVATIARQAHKAIDPEPPEDDEVVISLH